MSLVDPPEEHGPDSAVSLSATSVVSPTSKPAVLKQRGMAEDSADGLFAIEVGVDDYAETAANDAPSVPRTFQSEANFQAQKAAYSAKIDNGNNYEELLNAVPALKAEQDAGGDAHVANGPAKAKLTKKDGQLLGYAVGEMYYDRRFADIIDLCERVQCRCVLDGKTEASLRKWILRCRERLNGT